MSSASSDKYKYENGVAGHLPKYWDAEEERVFVWQPNLPTEYPLEHLLGTYKFFCVYKEGKPNYILFDPEPGFLNLSLRPGTECAPENVLGVFEVGTDGWRGGTFSGLIPENVTEGPPRPTLYRVNLTTSLKNYVPLKGHALEVLDAVDDNGNNYVHIRLDYFNWESTCKSYMAKKQLAAAQKTTLTQAERHRLEMSPRFEEVEFYGKNPGLQPATTTTIVALNAIPPSTWGLRFTVLYDFWRALLRSLRR